MYSSYLLSILYEMLCLDKEDLRGLTGFFTDHRCLNELLCII